jgi:calicheamicin 3'-O-methyl-rhamnosyltransferase
MRVFHSAPDSCDFGNADAVVSAGTGIRLDQLTSEAVAEHARALLSDEAIRDAARRMAEDIAAMPGPDEVVAELTR